MQAPSGFRPQDIRNIALLGHAGSGKTSLSEAILHRCGTISRLGSVETDSTIMADEDAEKQRRTEFTQVLGGLLPQLAQLIAADPAQGTIHCYDMTGAELAGWPVLVLAGIGGPVAAGDMVFPFVDIHKVRPDPLTSLTHRERDLLAALESGQSNAQLAREFGVSINTVKFHLRNLFGKLDVRNRTQAICLYLETRR
jgi:DNA-binding CsgD family transcriptional regulator